MKGLSAAAFKSWEPTLCSFIAVSCGFIVLYPQHFANYPIVVDFAKFVGLGGLAVWGIYTKSASLGSNLPTGQIPASLRDEESQKEIGQKPPETNPSLLDGIKHEEAAKH